MMQDIERGPNTSSSVSQHPVITTEQTVPEITQSGAGSFVEEMKQKLLDALQDLLKGFRRPRFYRNAPDVKQSIRAAFYRSCKSLPAGCLLSIP